MSIMPAPEPLVEEQTMADPWDALQVNIAPCSSTDGGHRWDDWDEPTRVPLAHFPKDRDDLAVTAFLGRCRACRQPLLGLARIRTERPEWTAALGGVELR